MHGGYAGIDQEMWAHPPARSDAQVREDLARVAVHGAPHGSAALEVCLDHSDGHDDGPRVDGSGLRAEDHGDRVAASGEPVDRERERLFRSAVREVDLRLE